eukprot:1162462-Pyramimonas_sp.AAC.1
MMSDHWRTGHRADVARDHLPDTLIQCHCFGRVGSGSSIWAKDARFTREHLPGLIGGPHVKGPVAHSIGQRRATDLAPICAREMQRDEELKKMEAHIETAHHGANFAALASVWSKKG